MLNCLTFVGCIACLNCFEISDRLTVWNVSKFFTTTYYVCTYRLLGSFALVEILRLCDRLELIDSFGLFDSFGSFDSLGLFDSLDHLTALDTLLGYFTVLDYSIVSFKLFNASGLFSIFYPLKSFELFDTFKPFHPFGLFVLDCLTLVGYFIVLDCSIVLNSLTRCVVKHLLPVQKF